MRFHVRMDEESNKEIMENMKKLSDKDMVKVAVRAINRAEKSMAAELSKYLREVQQYNMLSGFIKNHVSVRKQLNAPNIGFEFRVRGRRMPLELFVKNPKKEKQQIMYRRKGKPITYEVIKGRTKTLQSAFIMNKKYFNRNDPAIDVPYIVMDNSLPTPKRMFRASLPEMIGSKEAIAKIQDVGIETLKTRLKHEIEHIMKDKK